MSPPTPTPAEVADQFERLALDQRDRHQQWLRSGGDAFVGQQCDRAQERLCLFAVEHRALIVRALRALGEPSEAAVERAAEALCGCDYIPDSWDKISPEMRAKYRDHARAALRAAAEPPR